jgi:hypothetical protein
MATEETYDWDGPWVQGESESDEEGCPDYDDHESGD